ncbi:NAD(P)-dependent oxidoreductase [Ornithinimicrobium panacihumi]|uniref:NAD(P)-dependent oxidoreductase n=1 Tax=Ornithinimicrobium panacihumi TaxID=2008449 RepID=UPI003F8C7612
MARIAFIGLGIMGSPMSVNLQNAGHEVVGFNPNPERAADLVAAGGTSAESSAEAVKDADVVAIMVPDSPDVRDVLTSEGGVFDSARPGTLIIDFSSIRPDVTAELAKEAWPTCPS